MPNSRRWAVFAVGALAAGCGGGPLPETPAAPAMMPPATAGDTTGLTRVRFDRGTTSGIVSDSLEAGETRGYLLGAERGQIMMVHAIAWSPRPDPEIPATTAVRVYTLDGGAELSDPSGEGPLWSGRLPLSGDYLVRVSATGATAYTLAMQIPRRLSPGADDPTAAIAGTAPSRAPVDYIIQGREGQVLAASVRESDPATLHLYGLDRGEQLAPLAERRHIWSGPLPATQDYIISVVPASEGASYQLTVAVR